MRKKSLLLASIVAFLACSIAQAQAPTVPATGQPAPAHTTADTPLLVRVQDGQVTLNWTTPEGDIRKVEVCRHVRSRIEGRRRVATVANDATTWSEPLPDTTRTYWYSVKVTLTDDNVINIGPASTKTAGQ